MISINRVLDCFFFFCLDGTCSANWNGDPVWCVSCLHGELRC